MEHTGCLMQRCSRGPHAAAEASPPKNPHKRCEEQCQSPQDTEEVQASGTMCPMSPMTKQPAKVHRHVDSTNVRAVTVPGQAAKGWGSKWPLFLPCAPYSWLSILALCKQNSTGQRAGILMGTVQRGVYPPSGVTAIVAPVQTPRYQLEPSSLWAHLWKWIENRDKGSLLTNPAPAELPALRAWSGREMMTGPPILQEVP